MGNVGQESFGQKDERHGGEGQDLDNENLRRVGCLEEDECAESIFCGGRRG